MTEHEACLARIDKLERELFPQWFPPLTTNYTQIVSGYAKDLIRLSWQQDPKNGGLVPSEREAVTMNLPMSATSLRPGAMWPVQDHDDIRIAQNYTQIVRSPKKRIILP